jgi:hypothetical protein
MTVPDPEEGVAVLSKHPIVHTETFTLTTDPDAEVRPPRATNALWPLTTRHTVTNRTKTCAW